MHMIWLICLSPLRSMIVLQLGFFLFMQHLLHDCTLNPVSYERLCIVFDVCHLLYDQRFLKNDKFTSRCIFGDHSSLKRLGERSLLQIIHWFKTERWYRSVMDIDLYQYKLRFICWANVWWFYIFQICKAFWGEKVNVLHDLSVSHCMSFEGC